MYLSYYILLIIYRYIIVIKVVLYSFSILINNKSYKIEIDIIKIVYNLYLD